jgi:signal transduction histidine kinase
MTVKKQTLLLLVLVAVFSVLINSLVLSFLINRYFTNYVKENYAEHYSQIVQYVTNALESQDFSVNQMKIELETHLVDPVTRIKVYDKDGNLLADVSSEENSTYSTEHMSGMMGGMMRNMKNAQVEEVEHTALYNGDTVIGQLNISKYSSAENSVSIWMFQGALIKNGLLSIVLVLAFSLGIGILISRKMSRDLINTANLAQNIEMGNETKKEEHNEYSGVKEIRVIQQSLMSLDSKLKLRQKSRKAVIDEFVHQTRTPLTIMKSHLEGMEDGIVDMSAEEIKICEQQIENITEIIANMSNLIDAQKQEDDLHVEELELRQLLRQIMNGLRVQFEKKNLVLTFQEHSKIMIQTDKYKLSQAVYNILTNAYKFTQSGGMVNVDYEVLPEKVVLTIADNGQGIKTEEVEHIFEAYYKGSGNASDLGDGLGLYVAKENLMEIGAQIKVQSKSGEGSVFEITIPRK